MNWFSIFRRIMAFILISIQISCSSRNRIIWQLGKADDSAREFAMAPSGYNDFLKNDFGWEDQDFIIGTNNAAIDWPYVLPGPRDSWGGTSGTAGWRSHVLNILFELKRAPASANWKLIVDLFDCSAEDPPLFKITVNGKPWKYQLEAGSNSSSFPDSSGTGKEKFISVNLDPGLIRPGGNEITLTSLQGSWLQFDQIRLEGPSSARLQKKQSVFIRGVKPADYEIRTDKVNAQPLLVDVEQVKGTPRLDVLLDGEKIFTETVETGRYVFEAPMPAIEKKRESEYKILIDGKIREKGKVVRIPSRLITPSGYVNTMMGTAHSRWMIAPGPWMPFSMVKLSPDNQNSGWQAGYDPIFESIGGFSHIHEWTLSGLLTMPVTGPLVTEVGDQSEPRSGYRSRIDKMTENASLGYYRVHLTDYDVWAELTATTRCGFQRYTFPEGKKARVLLDLKFPSEYGYLLDEVKITRVNDFKVEGYSKQHTPNAWEGGITQEYTVHFVAEFDKPIIHTGVWTEKGVEKDTSGLFVRNSKDAGMYVEFDTGEDRVIQMRTSISYVSTENANKNLQQEIARPFGWNFEKIVAFNRQSWDSLLGRIAIQCDDRREKIRFYTNLYHSFCSRNTYSDVDGSWVDANEQVQHLKDKDQQALGCDAFWNTFWNLNQIWNLVAPEWSNRWVNSELAMYDANGWLAKGPAGMEYIPVMVAEHEIPLIVGAYQMGIRNFDAEKAFRAMKKMQTSPGKAVAGGFAGNRDLVPYMKHHYVPMDEGRFSNSLEYSFDDWTVSQMAKALGKGNDYRLFAERGKWWRNVIDPESGYARLKKADGTWDPDFDPFRSGANFHYVEGNAWQLTCFVPQNIPELANIVGRKRLLERLEWGFEESYKWRYNAPNDQYWDYPVIQGNQQSMHFAFLFNWLGKPWLTQKWSRSIIDRYYGYGLANAYLGDEDQGQMSAWFIMASLGLFQTDGGCKVNPEYEIASPLYPEVEINLGNRFGRGDKFTIVAANASRLNKYVQSAKLNGKLLTDFKFPASELLKGGKLELQMGPNPNLNWGVQY